MTAPAEQLDRLTDSYRKSSAIGRGLLELLSELAEADDQTVDGRKSVDRLDKMLATRARHLNRAQSIIDRLPPRSDLDRAAAGSPDLAEQLGRVGRAAEESQQIGDRLGRVLKAVMAGLDQQRESFTTGQKLMKGYKGHGVRPPLYVSRSA